MKTLRMTFIGDGVALSDSLDEAGNVDRSGTRRHAGGRSPQTAAAEAAFRLDHCFLRSQERV